MSEEKRIKLGKILGQSAYEKAVADKTFVGTETQYIDKEMQTYQDINQYIDKTIPDKEDLIGDKLVRHKNSSPSNSSIKNAIQNADKLNGYDIEHFVDPINEVTRVITETTNFLNNEYDATKETVDNISAVIDSVNDKKILDNAEYPNIETFLSLIGADSCVYGTRFNAMQSEGTKTLSNSGLVCEPSTDTVRGRDDYDYCKLFQHWDVNAYVDKNGFKHITAIEGDDNFDRYNKDTYVMYPTWYISTKVPSSNKYEIQVTGVPKEGFKPLNAAINPDGTISPYMIFAKYLASEETYGTISGAYPSRHETYQHMLTRLQPKAGNQYTFTNPCDLLFLQLLMVIKYATFNSPSIMAGCTDYNYTIKCTANVGDSSVKVLATDANNLVIGSTVQLGHTSSPNSADRNNASTYDIIKNIQIKAITSVNDTESVITFVENFSSPVTGEFYIFTIHWKNGSTDNVLGSDGSPVSNTNGKYPYKLGGIEVFVGGCEIMNFMSYGNSVSDLIYDEFYTCNDSKKVSMTQLNDAYKKAGSCISSTSYYWVYVSRCLINLDEGLTYPIEFKGSSTTGYKSSILKLTTVGQLNSIKAFANLGDKPTCNGLWSYVSYPGFTSYSWAYNSRKSPNGNYARLS